MKKSPATRVVFCALCGEKHHVVPIFMEGLTCKECGCGRFLTDPPLIFSTTDRRFLKSLRISTE